MPVVFDRPKEVRASGPTVGRWQDVRSGEETHVAAPRSPEAFNSSVSVAAEWTTPFSFLFVQGRVRRECQDDPYVCYAGAFAINESEKLVQTANQDQSDYLLFTSLLESWRRERVDAIWAAEFAMCPSYQKIIKMGERAIPLILRELKIEGDEPDHWFWALRILADTNPVHEKHRGDIVAMAKDWISWGRQSGYLE